MRSHAAFLRVRETIASMTAQIAESVSGMAVIQAYNRERAFLGEFDAGKRLEHAANTHAQWSNSLFFPGIEFLGIIAMTAVLWVGGHLIGSGSLAIGTLVAAVFMLNLVFQPLQELSDLYGQVQSAGAAMEKITTVLDTQPEITDKPDAHRAERIDGDLHLDRVTFAYGKEPVLHAIDIHVPAGGCLALVGESGGGKSTTAKLVGRFYDPDDGAIRVDGCDLRELSSARTAGNSESSCKIRSCSQGRSATTSASHGPNATDEMVADVAQAVGVDRIARRFDAGLAHTVREGGAGLSAGERQLISMHARSSPTHRPDPRRGDVEHRSPDGDPDRARARPAPSGRTSIIIAHRLATVRRADEILVMRAWPSLSADSSTPCWRPTARSGGSRRSCRRLEGQLQDRARTLQARPVTGSRGKQLGESCELRARVAPDEELVDAA